MKMKLDILRIDQDSYAILIIFWLNNNLLLI